MTNKTYDNVILFPARPCPDIDDVCDPIHLCVFHYHASVNTAMVHHYPNDLLFPSIEDDINFNNRD